MNDQVTIVPYTVAGNTVGITVSGGIGDINSTAKGTGARYNVGKANLELIPVWIIAEAIPLQKDQKMTRLHCALVELGEFQETHDEKYLKEAFAYLEGYWNECAEVFDYGRNKYAEWNWAKGMSWSAVVGCALRHATAALIKREANDPESGKSHLGHFMCNLVMLRQFVESFPEGNDLPPPELFKPSK